MVSATDALADRAREALRVSESRYRRLFETAQDGILLLNADSAQIEDVNPYLINMLGYSHAEFLGKKLWEVGSFADRVESKQMFAELQAKGYVRYEDLPLKTKAGAEIDVEFVSNTYDCEGIKIIQCNIRDITERKAAEGRFQRLTRLYDALSHCNKAIVHCASQEELLQQVCRAAVEFGGMKMAWIGFVDPDTMMIRVAASVGDRADEYLQGIEISADAGSPFGRGSCGIAIREIRPVWNQDFDDTPLTASRHERRTSFGWRASAVLPLHRNGVPVGVFALYSGIVGAFDEPVRHLLSEMAADIDFAIDNLDREAARKQAGRHLLESEARFRGLVEQSIAGTYIIQDGKLAYVNPRYAEILGYDSADEMINRDPLSIVAEVDRDTVAEHMRQRIEGSVPSATYTYTALRKDSSVVRVGVHTTRATHLGRPAIIGLLQDISEKERAEQQIRQYIAELEGAFMSTVEVATTLSEMRDPYTVGHERRVAELAVAIGAELGFDARRQEGLRVAGYLHDVGKIAIPAEILSKPTKLSALEYQMIQGHPQSSYDVLKGVKFPWPVAEIARQHHERMDGSGYPQGLKGEAILLEARIMAVADVVEAMSSHRPYRPGFGIDKALAEIERGRRTVYDADAASACLRLFREEGYQLPA